jgi:membrane protein implicated in regulation of membrane protease activity
VEEKGAVEMPWCPLFLVTPLFGLALFLALPVGAAMPAYLLLSGFSLLIYSKIVQALHAPVTVGRAGRIGRKALATSSLRPKGLVRYRGELWTAIWKEPVRSGKQVRIVAVDRASPFVEGDREHPAGPLEIHGGREPVGVRCSPFSLGALRDKVLHVLLKGDSHEKRRNP